MRVAYFLDREEFRWMADVSLRSLRRFMPHVEVWHLTDALFPPLAGADTVSRRTERPGNFMERWSAQRDNFLGDMLFVDCDTIFRADVGEVFEEYLDFDVALPHIRDPHVRYDGGVVFSRSPLFWQTLRRQPAYTCANDETEVSEIVKTFNRVADSFPGTVVSLPGAVFSYVPKNADDPCTGSAIVHYRGPRKKWMKDK